MTVSKALTELARAGLIERRRKAGSFVARPQRQSALLEIRDKSIRFRHEMRNAETGEIAAACEITAVHMDRAERKSTAFAATIRESAAKHLVAAEPAARESALTLAEVDRALEALASVRGAGSGARRERALRELLARASTEEQSFLLRLLVGELDHLLHVEARGFEAGEIAHGENDVGRGPRAPGFAARRAVRAEEGECEQQGDHHASERERDESPPPLSPGRTERHRDDGTSGAFRRGPGPGPGQYHAPNPSP